LIDPPTFSLLWQVYDSHTVWKVKLYREEDTKVKDSIVHTHTHIEAEDSNK